jgi:hypothetical protein
MRPAESYDVLMFIGAPAATSSTALWSKTLGAAAATSTQRL